MLSITRIEHQNINCIWDNPEFIYKFDRPYFVSSISSDLLHTIKYLYENKIELTIHNVVTYGSSRNAEITKENLVFLRSQEYNIEEFDFYFSNLNLQKRTNRSIY